MQKKKKGFSETCWKVYYTKARVLLIKEKKCLVLFMQIRKQAFHDNPPWDTFCLNSLALS